MDIKLANLIKEFALEQEKSQVNRYEVTEAIRNYARIGEQLRVNNNIMEAAKQLARMAEDAQHHVLGENDDWFDSVSIKRNMNLSVILLILPSIILPSSILVFESWLLSSFSNSFEAGVLRSL